MLLRALAAATFVLSLGACVQRDYLVANPAENGMPAGEARYTDNVSYITSYSPNVEVIPLRLDPAFPADERREILRAVGEWNHVLNGYVRFELAIRVFHAEGQRSDPAPPRANVWSILPARGAAPIGGRVARPMALVAAPAERRRRGDDLSRRDRRRRRSPPRCAMSSAMCSACCTIRQAA